MKLAQAIGFAEEMNYLKKRISSVNNDEYPIIENAADYFQTLGSRVLALPGVLLEKSNSIDRDMERRAKD